MKKNQKGFGIVEVLIFVVIVGLLATTGWLVYDRQKSKSSNKPANTQASQQKASQVAQAQDPYQGWKIYDNTAYSFSFKYPEALSLASYAGTGGPSTNKPATPTSDNVFVDAQDSYFSVDVTKNIKLDSSYIKRQFGATNPNDIVLEPLSHNGISGFKVVFKQNVGAVSEFYFFQKANSLTIYKVVVQIGSGTAAKIFDTLWIQ